MENHYDFKRKIRLREIRTNHANLKQIWKQVRNQIRKQIRKPTGFSRAKTKIFQKLWYHM